MRVRNGEHGYGVVTKTLHWVTVVLFALQFWVGYTMETDRERVDCDPAGERLSGGETSDAEEERLDRLEERCEAREEAIDETAEGRPAALHVWLGLALLVLGAARVVWRRIGSLPPWSDRLGPGGRRAEGLVEKALLALMFAVPASGLLLLVSGDLVALHVAAHVAFFTALAIHLAVVVRHGLLPRMLPRLLPRTR